MKEPNLLALQAAFVAARLGWAGWSGLGALVLAALTVLLGAPILQANNMREARELASLETQLKFQADPKAAQRARDPLTTLVTSLPSPTSVPDFLTAVQRRADQEAVQIDRTDYRMQPVLGQAAQRYRLRFPAHADYPHLRVWLERLLHDYPSLSLDEISLRRAVDGGEELEVSIGLSFLTRATP